MNFTKPVFEVGNIIRDYQNKIIAQGYLNAHKKKVFTNLAQCRTKALGYHLDRCDNTGCGHEKYSYNSCRDRHCPKCNGLKREKWVWDREADLLPITYFHVVFTVPDWLNQLFLDYPVPMFNLLFESAWQTIKIFGAGHKYLGAQTGMTSLLHTWGQNLSFHPHLHCIVPGGGVSQYGKWKCARSKGKYLFPVKALSNVFRGKFCDGLMLLHNKKKIVLQEPIHPVRKDLHPLYKNPWVVYAKQPMYNASQAVNYIGRYSHRVAISNHRIKSVSDDKVGFSWFNYKTSKTGVMHLSTQEFLRRFSMHILPSGFMKIRHYGILSSRNKKDSLEIARNDLNATPVTITKGFTWKQIFETKFGHHPDRCPKCLKGTMVRIETVLPPARGSPKDKLTPNFNFYA